MFGINLIQSIVGGVAAVAVSFLSGMWYGNHYGSSALKLASAQAQLETTNKTLQTLQVEDALNAAAELGRQDQRDKDFAKTAPTLNKCVLDKNQVDALNKLTDGG